ncbi:E3 SUMO-protein ligase PIAS2 isoform X1 [Hydra vulgaris]|uniref:E3 SUMO-protein ligase PIAS2 isoform X1 n=1 Tax=Hydra vulgaris TaxID=6087 RepID=UPI001F5FE4AB|nr:E3 SUMO-protein ligase PIAS2 isoform X1 [Hydra vulgaris]
MSSRDGKGEDLKSMLMSFRIAELQTLLGACGRSRSGRKHELLGRAISLLKSSSVAPNRDKVRARILELYHQRYPPGGVELPEIALGNPSSLQTYPAQPYMQYPREEDDDSSNFINRSSNSYKDLSHKTKYSSVFHHPHNSQQLQPTSYTSATSLHSPVPIHPDVRFIPLPFYDIIDVLIKPTSLVQKTMAGYQEMSFVYHLTPYQTQLITSSRSYTMKSILEYGVQVHLRFCLAETSCFQEDAYPPRLKVIANNKPCLIPGQPPPNAQNQEPRKPHRPINITPVNISPLQSNQFSVQWMPSDVGQRYTTTVHLVKTVHCETLIQQLANKPERSAEHTKAFITEKLRQDPESEIALTSLKVSLCCPIGKTRMKYPCRANNCHHLQCFDGATYLQMNERKPSWVCPVCDKKAHFSDLFKDGMFSSIIKQSVDCDDIVFFEDGSWRPLNEIQDLQKPLSQQLLSTPKSASSKPPNLVDFNTPNPTTIFTPVITKCNSENIVPEIPKLNRIAKPAQKSVEEPEVEVISIDSDTDDETTILLPTMAQRNTQCQKNDSLLSPLSPPPSSSSVQFQDPELQGMELYNLLPHEDRIAAAMYLDQVGILGQLTSNSSRNVTSSTSVIDISDE